MVSADRELWDDADGYFQRCLELAEQVGDVHLRGLGLLNHSEVHLARQRYEPARRNAEEALGVFDRLGARLDKADAYKLIGRVYRETGRHALAEARLRAAVDLAVTTGSVLSEAEASRELALLYQAMGRTRRRSGSSTRPTACSAGSTRGWIWWTCPPRWADWKTPTWPWCGTGVNRSSHPTATPSVTADGWPAMRWRWRGRSGSTRLSRRPSGSGPTSTIWARSRCRTKS